MAELNIVALVLGSYVATNMDNLLIIVSHMLSGKASSARVASGHAIATVTVLALSVTLGLSSNLMPVELIGYLGVVPIGLGIRSLIDQTRSSKRADADIRAGTAIGIGLTLTANSTDSVLIFSPLLADSNSTVDLFITATFVVAAATWFWIAKIASQRAAKLDVINKVAGWIAPLIMIYVGVYILMNTATDVI